MDTELEEARGGLMGLEVRETGGGERGGATGAGAGDGDGMEVEGAASRAPSRDRGGEGRKGRKERVEVRK